MPGSSARSRRRSRARSGSRVPAPRPAASAPAAFLTPARAGAILLGAVLVGVLLYHGALRGPFFSDDLHYVSQNPWVTAFSPSDLPEIFDPGGETVVLTENYTPLHVLLHALAWSVFGDSVVGHHLVNVTLHACVACLFALLLLRSGLGRLGAAFGGLLILVHPANVEAVAWISQLKTTSATSLALLALLLLPRRPALASGAFLLALLAKPTSAFALPVAVLFTFVRWREEPDASRRAARWLAAWAAIFVAYAAVEMVAFTHAVSGVAPVHPDPLVRMRTSVGFVARYAVMALSGRGLAAFHEPPPALSWLDPWWLGGFAIAIGLGARTLFTLAKRREEGVYWAWAGLSFLPVAQIWPFPFPLADRYLYMILPGLVGGLLLLGRDVLAPVWRRVPRLATAAPVAGAALLAVFAVQTAARATLFRSPSRLVAESAARYPNGVNAHMLRAREAMAQGRPADAVRALAGAEARGYERFERVLSDPTFASLRGRPDFDAVISAMAGRWIARLGGRDDLSQYELWSLGLAHLVRGEQAAGRRALERALERPGPLEDAIRTQLRQLEAGGQAG